MFLGIFHSWNTWLYCSRSITKERIWDGVWLVCNCISLILISHVLLVLSWKLICIFQVQMQISLDILVLNLYRLSITIRQWLIFVLPIHCVENLFPFSLRSYSLLSLFLISLSTVFILDLKLWLYSWLMMITTSYNVSTIWGQLHRTFILAIACLISHLFELRINLEKDLICKHAWENFRWVMT